MPPRAKNNHNKQRQKGVGTVGGVASFFAIYSCETFNERKYQSDRLVIYKNMTGIITKSAFV